MTVFKGYMKMVRKNMGITLMFFGIFLGIAFILNVSAQKDSAGDFSSKKVDVAVVDLDQSELSKSLTAYLQKKHNVTLEADNKSRLAEELYYGGQTVVLRMEEGFEKNALEGKGGINLTNRPGTYSGIFLEQQINKFVGNVMTYRLAGYSISEGCSKVLEQREGKVFVEDLNGNEGIVPAYVSFFGFFPYICIAICGATLGRILFLFREKGLKNRMMASVVSLTRQNGETVLAFLILGTAMYLITIFFAVLLYGSSVLSAPNLGWIVLNGFLMVLVSLEIAFLIGLSIKKEVHANNITTPLSLGMSFLGGVFVPLSVMKPEVKAVAKFIPVYWYETVNDVLAEHAEIAGTVKEQLFTGIGMQVLFVLALAGIGMAVSKYQQQER